MSTREIKESLIKAGKEAAIDLTEVAKQKILTQATGRDPLAAEKLKAAAASKRLAIFDAFEILDKVQKEEDKLKEADEAEEAKLSGVVELEDKPVTVKKTDFERPEARA